MKDIKLLEPFIREIGHYQLKNFRKSDLSIITKTTDIDLVTEVDKISNDRIIDFLTEHFPDDNIITEEAEPVMKNKSMYTWVVDPLDGTTNFSIGSPIFAISIGKVRHFGTKDQKPVLGIIYIPTLNELYYAMENQGSYLISGLTNSTVKLSTSSVTDLKASVLSTGFPYDRAISQKNNSRSIQKMIPLIKGIRRMGAAAYDMCLVAQGIYDAHWEIKLSIWDITAGQCIIEEAGGYFFSQTYEDGRVSILTGNKELCEKIRDIVEL